jgi:hypothetical protein
MKLHVIGIDLGKTVFHLVGLDSTGRAVIRKKCSRKQLLAFTANLEVQLIGMESSSGSHFLGRALREQGHEVRLMPAQYVKPAMRFGSATVDHQGEQYFFEVQVYLDELDPEAVQLELYAEGQNGSAPFRRPMNRGERLVGSQNGFMYAVQVPATRPADDYTPRLIPHYAAASVPLEASFILWYDSPAWQ